MLPRTIRHFSAACLWIGLALIAMGAVLPALAPKAVAGAVSSTQNVQSVAHESNSPDQVLREDAAAVKRRVEEFRERARAEDENGGASRVCYWVGALLVLGGLVGRLTGDRRNPGVEAR